MSVESVMPSNHLIFCHPLLLLPQSFPASGSFPMSPVSLKEVSKCQSLSHVQLFVIPRTVACQAPLSMRFSRQEYWSWLSFPSSGDLPYPVIKPMSPAWQADFFTTEPPGKPYNPGKQIQSKQKVTLTPYRIGKNSLLSRSATTILNLTSCCEFQGQ